MLASLAAMAVVAGMSASDGDLPCTVAGPTGFGVRLLAEYVQGYA